VRALVGVEVELGEDAPYVPLDRLGAEVPVCGRVVALSRCVVGGRRDTVEMLSARALADLLTGGEPHEAVAPSGFAELDQLTGGMSHGRVWLVVGRPGEGVTTLLVQWAAAIASQPGEHVHLVTPRESPQAVAARLYAMSGLIPLNRIPARLDEEAQERQLLARDRLNDMSLSLYAKGDDSYVPEVHPTRAAVPSTAIVIDDADTVSGVTPQRVGQWAREGMSVLLSMPRHHVLPGGDDWDLDAGWSRVADVVLEIQHRQLYDPSKLRPGEADLHLRYNRHGYVRSLTVLHQAHYSRFLESPTDLSPSS
jgi:replicative DNA helicase